MRAYVKSVGANITLVNIDSRILEPSAVATQL
jgi:hypothetical protein